MDDNQRGAELRIALSMRGGVSLAVWIGGAVEELDRLTRANASDYDPSTDIGPPDTYAALLALGGYQRAALDVITGASAGGLNGVVLAASRAYGFKFSAMLPIWVRLADIDELAKLDEEGRRSNLESLLLQLADDLPELSNALTRVLS